MRERGADRAFPVLCAALTTHSTTETGRHDMDSITSRAARTLNNELTEDMRKALSLIVEDFVNKGTWPTAQEVAERYRALAIPDEDQ